MVASPSLDPFFFLRLARAVADGRAVSDPDRAGVATRLTARAAVGARRDPDGELVADFEHPGYLKRAVENRTVFVPAHLAPVFPGMPLLADVVRTADRLSLNAGHPICLSGSTTFLGRSHSASDLDFCEYFLTSPQAIPDAVAAKAAETSGGVLVRFKCGGDVLKAPWCDLPTVAPDLLFADDGEQPARRFKLDFVQRTQILGLMPSTSVVLPLDPDSIEGPNARFSFVYQEAVITSGVPPRSLLSAERLAHYLLWLRGDVRSWLGEQKIADVTEAPLKALKRVLSLLLTVGRDDLVEPCIEVLSSEEIADVSFGARIADLKAMIADIDLETGRPFLEELDELISRLPHALPTPTQCAEALLGARELAEELLGEVDLMFEAAA